jgi:hypothetical protein
MRMAIEAPLIGGIVGASIANILSSVRDGDNLYEVIFNSFFLLITIVGASAISIIVLDTLGLVGAEGILLVVILSFIAHYVFS